VWHKLFLLKVGSKPTDFSHEVIASKGKIICCDVSQEYTSIGKKYWKEAGVEHKIDLR
jgi:predicted O-methyltransferase YrrM